MKKIYWVVLMTFLTTLFVYLGQVIHETYDMAVPNAKTLIEVVEWDKTVSSSTIYERLEEESKHQGVTLYKVTFATSDQGRPIKNIYVFPTEASHDKIGLTKDSDVKSSQELTVENPLGSYYLSEMVPDDLLKAFEELGLTVNVESNLLKMVLFYFLSGELGYSLIFLFVIIFVIDVFVFVAQSKALGVLQLHGLSPYRLLLPTLSKDMSLITFFVLGGSVLLPFAMNVFLVVGLAVFENQKTRYRHRKSLPYILP